MDKKSICDKLDKVIDILDKKCNFSNTLTREMHDRIVDGGLGQYLLRKGAVFSSRGNSIEVLNSPALKNDPTFKRLISEVNKKYGYNLKYRKVKDDRYIIYNFSTGSDKLETFPPKLRELTPEEERGGNAVDKAYSEANNLHWKQNPSNIPAIDQVFRKYDIKSLAAYLVNSSNTVGFGYQDGTPWQEGFVIIFKIGEPGNLTSSRMIPYSKIDSIEITEDNIKVNRI